MTARRWCGWRRAWLGRRSASDHVSLVACESSPGEVRQSQWRNRGDGAEGHWPSCHPGLDRGRDLRPAAARAGGAGVDSARLPAHGPRSGTGRPLGVAARSGRWGLAVIWTVLVGGLPSVHRTRRCATAPARSRLRRHERTPGRLGDGSLLHVPTAVLNGRCPGLRQTLLASNASNSLGTSGVRWGAKLGEMVPRARIELVSFGLIQSMSV